MAIQEQEQLMESSQEVLGESNKKKVNKKNVSRSSKKNNMSNNKENVLTPQKKLINKKEIMSTLKNKSFDNKESPLHSTSIQNKENENSSKLAFSAHVSVVPYFKKTPMPINSPNLQRTTHLPTNKITVTKSENFAVSSWNSHTPNKSTLPRPPARWMRNAPTPDAPITEDDFSISTPGRSSPCPTSVSSSPCPRSPCISSTCSKSSSPFSTPSSKSPTPSSSKSPSSLLSAPPSKHFKFCSATTTPVPRNISSDLEKLFSQVEDCNNSMNADENSIDDVRKEIVNKLDLVNSSQVGDDSMDSDVKSIDDESSVDDSLKENENKLDLGSSGYSSSVSEKEDCESQPNLLLAAILNSVAEDSVSCSMKKMDSSLSPFLNFSQVEKPFLGDHETEFSNDQIQISSPVNEELVNETLSQILHSIMIK